MPTAFEMKHKNAKFAENARAGKRTVNPSRQERLAKRSPINSYALGAVIFVVCGGVLFEIARLVFL